MLGRAGVLARESFFGHFHRRMIQISSKADPITIRVIWMYCALTESSTSDSLAGPEDAARMCGRYDIAFDIDKFTGVPWNTTMSKNILHTILETKHKEVEELRARTSLEALQAAAATAPRVRNFFTAVTKPPTRAVNLIAEVKKASPSKGVIREDFDPVELAKAYETAGADALSVLTDETYFQGHLDYLRAIRQAVDLPLLRKDFLIDPWQVYEARAAGADAILLIAAALPAGELMDLMILAAELRLTVLLEVHNADELMRVRSLVGFPHKAYSLLGINNRDLTTFEVDINTTLRLRELAGDDVPIVSESGIVTPQHVSRLAAEGVNAVLVGETFMRQENIVQAVHHLLGPKKG